MLVAGHTRATRAHEAALRTSVSIRQGHDVATFYGSTRHSPEAAKYVSSLNTTPHLVAFWEQSTTRAELRGSGDAVHARRGLSNGDDVDFCQRGLTARRLAAIVGT